MPFASVEKIYRSMPMLILTAALLMGCAPKSSTASAADSENQKHQAVESPASLGSWAKKINGQLLVPTIEMHDDNTGASVLLVGMIHNGPTTYYDRVSKIMDQWAKASTEKTVVLKEFGTCSTEVYDSPQSDKVPAADVAKVGTIVASQKPEDFRVQSDASVVPIFNLLQAQKTACVLDVDGKTKRPSYLVARNQALCNDAASKPGYACQFLALHYPEAAYINQVNADLVFDKYGYSIQLAGVFMYRGFSAYDSDYQKIDVFMQYVIMNFRVQLLEKEIQEQLGQGNKRLVIPWGAAHTKDLREALGVMGFHQTELHDVLWADETDVARIPDLAETYNDATFTDHYEFQ
jgi:hypothetical protein